MVRAPQPPAALDLDDVGRRALDLGAHRAQKGDQVVDLRLARGRADGRGPSASVAARSAFSVPMTVTPER